MVVSTGSNHVLITIGPANTPTEKMFAAKPMAATIMSVPSIRSGERNPFTASIIKECGAYNKNLYP